MYETNCFVNKSLPRPAVLAACTCIAIGTSATATTSFSLCRLPTTASAFCLLWVEPSFKPLSVTQGRDKLLRRKSQVHEITKAAPIALPVFVLATTGLSEIGHW